MRNFITIITLIIGFYSNALYSQNKRESSNREIETLEKLKKMKDSDESVELKSKQIIMSYNYGLKDIIREHRNELSAEKYKYVMDYQTLLWTKTYSNIKYYNSYKKFYEENYENLEKYKDLVMEKLYEYLN